MVKGLNRIVSVEASNLSINLNLIKQCRLDNVDMYIKEIGNQLPLCKIWGLDSWNVRVTCNSKYCERVLAVRVMQYRL